MSTVADRARNSRAWSNRPGGRDSRAGYAVYINMEDDGTGDPVLAGRAIAEDAMERIQSVWLPKQTPVWLDIETDNSWRGSTERHDS